MPNINFNNQKEVEWKDGDTYISGVKTDKVYNTQFAIEKDLEYLFGAGYEPLSIQNGNKQYPVTLGLYVGAIWSMNDAAIAAGGDDATDIAVDVVFKYKAYGQRGIRTVTIVGFQASRLPMGWQQNDKSMKVDLQGLCLRIKFS